MAVRLLACDLDGTLVGPGDKGIQEAQQVVEICRERGIAFTIATGRVFGAVENYLSRLGVDGPIIANGGALVAALGQDPIMQRTLEPGDAHRIAAFLRPLGMPFYFIAGKDMYTEWQGPETKQYSAAISYDISLVSSLDELDLSPTQVVVRVPAEIAGRYVALFSEQFACGATVMLSLPHLIEFQSKGVSKAAALAFLAGRLGIAREEVLAIGDGLNDLDMLAWAGKSACVCNARPEVAASVSEVATLPFSEGVLEIIKKTL